MGHAEIFTTQNIDINYPLAGLGNRILASLIDKLILVLLGLVFIIPAIGLFSLSGNEFRISGIVLLSVYGFIFLFYTLILEILFNGQTFGKRFMKIKVIRADGGSPTIGNYIVRWLLRLIDVNFLYGVVGIIAIAASSKEQRLGDLAAGTLVISLNKPVRFQHTIYRELPDGYEPRFPQVALLPEQDIRILQQVITKSQQTADPTDRYLLLKKAGEKMEQKLNTGSHPEALPFLQTIISDYNYFHQRES